MLKRAKKRKAASSSRSPKVSREPPAHHRSLSMVSEPQIMPVTQTMNTEQFSPTYDPSFSSPEMAMVHGQQHMSHMTGHMPNPAGTDIVNIDNIWRGFEMTANEQLPVWLSDQSLGGNSFSQNGMDAFLLPNDYLPPAPQIW
jgi:hypothetical protein